MRVPSRLYGGVAKKVCDNLWLDILHRVWRLGPGDGLRAAVTG